MGEWIGGHTHTGTQIQIKMHTYTDRQACRQTNDCRKIAFITLRSHFL